MNFIVAFLLVGSFFAFFVGLISPSTFGRKGKPAPSRLKVCSASAGVFLLCSIVLGNFASSKAGNSNSSSAAAPSAAPPTHSAAAAAASDTPVETPQPPRSDWTYFDQPDQITSKQIHFASVDASGKLDFNFPYSGGSTANLQIRKHPRYGTDVILSIDKGQFVCGVEACSVMVRFDDGHAARYSAYQPSDYSSTALFIKPSSKFITSARKAKRVVIEASFYQDGNRAMVFPIERLTW
ncbi:hypothetical protein [Cupriavidus sp. D39]|uniref:hypothetical protein n=1 Tax=Cupriavidus sp. D39 TaxID=2997877 RepID=UPI0022700E69|nr:hypothetical protein [Cupriavidus sp. D39]MCY0853001.1 hypothetical protein [Cupriavidus sp. D39]